MPAFALRLLAGVTDGEHRASLAEARESLEYWEHRARCLPVRAVRRRREARAMAARWQSRVALSERVVYGRGLLGAIVLLAAERRLPQVTVQRGRRAARRARRTAIAAGTALAALIVTALAATVQALHAVFGGLG